MTGNVKRSFIEEKIKEILSAKLGLDNRDIKSTSLLMNDFGLDSFDALRIIFEVEDVFNIKVPPTEVLDIRTVNDIVSYIQGRLSA